MEFTHEIVFTEELIHVFASEPIDPVINRIRGGNLPAGTSIRIGAPAEQPQEAITALIKIFSEKDNVLSARLGLMEILRVDAPSEFTYTIGIECASGEEDAISAAIEVLKSVPTGRWPISICPATNQFFTAEAIIFFRRQ